MIEIFWMGNSAVKIVSKTATVGINLLNDNSCNLLISTKPLPKKVDKDRFVIDSPGEYEAKSAMVYALIGEQGDKIKAAQLIVDHIACFYCDNFDFVPNEEQLDAMGTIDVLFLPIAVNKESETHIQKLTEMIDPRIIIPIATDDETSAEVCLNMAKTLGLKCEETMKSYKIKNRSQLPEEEQLFITLQKS
ncbi:MAG TPA: hypothetical protein PLZ62_02795 [bacterium]|nr:hypothetical protein [bacterium]